MLLWDVKHVLAMKGIERPYSWLRKLGISHSLAHRLANNKVHMLSPHHLELLCENLKCEPHDLLVWIPTRAQLEDKNHPLRNLMRDNRGTKAVALLQKLSIEEIRELQDLLLKKRDEGEEEGER